jgi:hypothetical protein
MRLEDKLLYSTASSTVCRPHTKTIDLQNWSQRDTSETRNLVSERISLIAGQNGRKHHEALLIIPSFHSPVAVHEGWGRPRSYEVQRLENRASSQATLRFRPSNKRLIILERLFSGG